MRKHLLCIALMCISFTLSAQFNESFSDGNFTLGPAWTGNTADWQVVSNSDVAAGSVASQTLRLNVAAGSGLTYLSAQVAGSWGNAQSWGFYVGRRGQAYTAANHALIWLWSSGSNLASPEINGYRIRIGDDGGGDEIVLQRVSNGAVTDILSGAALTNNLTDVGFLLRVVRSNQGKWEVFTSVLPVANGTGAVAADVPNAVNTPVSHGVATDNTHTGFDNGYIGFSNAYGSGAQARASQEYDQVQLSFAAATVPVKLGGFYAVKQDAVIKIFWEAFEEAGVDHYEVQRSTNGLQFETFGSVKAESKRSYQYTDDPLVNTQGFYRLRVHDVDGAISLSPVVSIRSIASAGLSIIPNPVGTIASIYHPSSPSITMLEILDLAARPILRHMIPPNTTQTNLNLAHLPKGTYCLVIITGDERAIRMLIKKIAG